MKKILLILLVLPVSILIHSQNENPFKKLGYDLLVATSSKGEFEEFHDQTDLVEIGSILFNTRTKQIVKILDEGQTTVDIPAATAAMSIDPHCERYYWISPYAYAANNPIKFIDPDGRDIWIFYKKDEADKNFVVFKFNGSNHSEAPKNRFVQDALTAYDYNIANGGGDNLKEAATNSSLKVGLVKSEDGTNAKTHMDISKNGKRPQMLSVVKWAPNIGLETSDGKATLSPASILEHEMDHQVDYDTKTAEHNKRVKQGDSQYDNKEERRVITGSEAKTARANKEFSKGYVRPDHRGTRVVVPNPTSNKKIRNL